MATELLRPTFALVNLEAVSSNLQSVRRKSGKKILAVVKAAAYGHGAVKVSETLVREGVEMLGVATIEEGIQLREAGIKTPVLVLGSVYPFDNYRQVIKYDLTPIIASLESAEFLEKTAAKYSAVVSAHMKVDTGMGRIGVGGGNASALWEKINSSPHINAEGVYTHLPRADEDLIYTSRQLKNFKQISGSLTPRPKLVHASNTAGIINFSPSFLNMVRPGLALYGLYPHKTSGDSIKLQPALTFKSAVIFLKTIPKGTPVSYGGTWKAPRDSKIATICAGYADGYRRDLSNSAHILIRGRRCPVVGRVCMDMIMVDVSSLPEVKIGDEAVLLGRQGEEEVSAEEIASLCKTVNYEITCGISSRVPRVYRGKDGV